MFDQSPHWDLGTAFPSVLRPLLICAKLGRWACQGLPVPGQSRCMWEQVGYRRGEVAAIGSYLCLSHVLVPLCLIPPPVPPFPSPTPLPPSWKPSLCLRVKPARPLSCPFPFCDQGWGRGAGEGEGREPGRKSSWPGREGGQLAESRMDGQWGPGLGPTPAEGFEGTRVRWGPEPAGKGAWLEGFEGHQRRREPLPAGLWWAASAKPELGLGCCLPPTSGSGIPGLGSPAFCLLTVPSPSSRLVQFLSRQPCPPNARAPGPEPDRQTSHQLGHGRGAGGPMIQPRTPVPTPSPQNSPLTTPVPALRSSVHIFKPGKR